MLNTRGQSLTFVDASVEAGKEQEEYFLKYAKKTYDKTLIQHANIYKHYDFSYDKIYKIELKGLYYSLDNRTNIATKKSNGIKISDAFIPQDKVLYYYYRWLRNPKLIFILIYGFYTLDENN